MWLHLSLGMPLKMVKIVFKNYPILLRVLLKFQRNDKFTIVEALDAGSPNTFGCLRMYLFHQLYRFALSTTESPVICMTNKKHKNRLILFSRM